MVAIDPSRSIRSRANATASAVASRPSAAYCVPSSSDDVDRGSIADAHQRLERSAGECTFFDCRDRSNTVRSSDVTAGLPHQAQRIHCRELLDLSLAVEHPEQRIDQPRRAPA